MRADKYLFDNGYAKSRQAAKLLIESGGVLCNGKPVNKASEQIEDASVIKIICEEQKYVSRGGYKLEGALESFKINPSGLVCADIGASTGGFTDCLLQHNAAKVYAIEGGTDQLDQKLRNDTRVISIEKTNARFITFDTVGEYVSLIVMDVSFISQKLLHEKVAMLLKPGGKFISLIKPQFEVGREKLGKHGIAEEKYHKQAIEDVKSSAALYGLLFIAIIRSPITGKDGNSEYLALFEKADTEFL